MPYAKQHTSKNFDQKSLKNVYNNATVIQLQPIYVEKLSTGCELQRLSFRKKFKDLPKRSELVSRKLGSMELLDRPTHLIASAHNSAEPRLPNFGTSSSKCKSKPLGLHNIKPNTKINVIEVKLNYPAITEGKKLHRYTDSKCFEDIKMKKTKTRGTQTIYRESSAQTLPFLPEVSNMVTDLEKLEISKLPNIMPENEFPDLYRVEVLERTRKRWALRRALKENQNLRRKKEVKGKGGLSKYNSSLQAFEWEHWIEREEYVQESQRLRFETLIDMFNKRQVEMRAASKARIERSYEQILARRDALLHKNHIEYEREMRQLEYKRLHGTKSWRKGNIHSQLDSPSYEFYGPQLHYGVNPSRTHFVGERREFAARMDDLEKCAVKFTQLVCPFARQKEWSKPKQRLLEIEKNFCSDENLQTIYQTLLPTSANSESEGNAEVPHPEDTLKNGPVKRTPTDTQPICVGV